MKKIVPAILTNDENDFASKLKLLEQIGVNEIQIDVIDGRFADNETVGLATITRYPTKMKREAHLMVVNPVAAAQEYLSAGIDSVIIHYERLTSLQDLDAFGRRLVGVAIDAGTPVSSIISIAQSVYEILILGVKAGFAGQTFLPETTSKITQLRQTAPSAMIAVDGGISDDLIAQIFEAGADRVVFNCQRIVDAQDPASYWRNLNENLKMKNEKLHRKSKI